MTKRKDTKAKAFTCRGAAALITAALLAAVFLFTGCPQSAENQTQNPSVQPAEQKVTLTVAKGEHVQKTEPASLTVAKGSAWSAVKGNITVTYEAGWEAAGWKFDSAAGSDISDATVFNENKTVFASAKPLVDQNLEIEGGVLKSCKQKPSGVLVIPADVTEIADNVFSDCFGLTQVHFPEGLKKIGKKAFMQCSGLSQLSLPKSLETLDDEAFRECTGMEGRIVLPENLKTIGWAAFYKCEKVGDFDFSGCTKLTEIKAVAFASCTGLEQLILHESLETLGEAAFSKCTGIKGTIILPKNLKIIGENAFNKCDQVDAFDVSHCTLLTKIDRTAFRECDNIRTFDFSQCTALTTIGKEAFANCKKIQRVILPVNLTTIKAMTFFGCTALTDLTVVSGSAKLYAAGNVIYSGDKKQLLCSAPTVKEVRLPPELIEISENAFYSNSELETVNFSDCNQLASIGKLAFNDCKSLSGMLNLPATLKTIGVAAFRGCEKLTSVDMSACSNLQKIDTSTFSQCKDLREVIFPASRLTICTQAFFDCCEVRLFDFYRCTQLILDGSNIFNYIPNGRYRVKKNSGIKEVLLTFGIEYIQEDD